MKKIIFSVIFLLLLTSCTNIEKQEVTKKKEVIQENKEKDYVDPYLDDNPIIVGLYQNQKGNKFLITSLNSPLTQYKDIASFEVYYTNENTMSGNQKTLWNNYYQTYQDIDNYKIGYHINFETTSTKIDKTILSPTDIESFFDYIQIYLYDDINQNSSWYSHITNEEITEKTKLTSIKLTASTKIDEIISPITLTVFTYDFDDFDEFNHYRGNSKYQITINRE